MAGDVVTSLFSSIGYALSNGAGRAQDGVPCLALEVVPIIEPYFSPETWKPRVNAPGANIVDKPESTIVRMIDWGREGNVIKSTFHYLVGDASSVSILSPSA